MRPTPRGKFDFRKLSKDRQRLAIDFLKTILPNHGSLGRDWAFAFLRSEVRLHCYYECVDINGKGLKWVPFEVCVYKDFSYRIEFRFGNKYAFPVKVSLEADLEDVFTEENAREWISIIGVSENEFSGHETFIM